MRTIPNSTNIEISNDTLQIATKPRFDSTTSKQDVIPDTFLVKNSIISVDSPIRGKTIKDNIQTLKSVSKGKPSDFIYPNRDSESLISNYQSITWNNSRSNKTCYILKFQPEKNVSSVFGKDKSLTTKFIEKGFDVKERKQNNQDWSFIPIFLGLSILAIVVALYRKFLIQLFERIIYHLKSSKSIKEKSIPFQRLTFLLDLLFIISFSLLADRAAIKLGLYTSPMRFEYLIFVLLSAFLIVLRIFRWIAYRLIAIFSDKKFFLDDLFSNSTLYTRALGVFLLPCVFLIAYTTGKISNIVIYFSLSIIVIVLVIRTIRILRVFVDGGFSIFYFILYLCALEIAPLLIIWKEVVSR
jgi:hypothetical protein